MKLSPYGCGQRQSGIAYFGSSACNLSHVLVSRLSRFGCDLCLRLTALFVFTGCKNCCCSPSQTPQWLGPYPRGHGGNLNLAHQMGLSPPRYVPVGLLSVKLCLLHAFCCSSAADDSDPSRAWSCLDMQPRAPGVSQQNKFGKQANTRPF